ncbi:MAG TPA: hypothetical protein PKV67_00960 [Hyphomonas sp.]|uniref:hypothetical protein n=1 Tax=Hyphomonas sp. TaxID=87 RepID=UPI0025B84CC3|nr:hypothetical protein [Hyphomonas sp.]HRI99316.1 hypothetical protein [Hyphomonas sp.]HRK66582.1 hypothetical protein [Hyphomonas sp.]
MPIDDLCSGQVEFAATPLGRSDPELANNLHQKRKNMAGKIHSPELTILKLREREVYRAGGFKVGEVIRRLGVDQITNYRRRQEYDGMKVDQAKCLKDLENDNAPPEALVGLMPNPTKRNPRKPPTGKW